MQFSLLFMAEYIKMIAVSMIFATLFLGGYYLPFQGALVSAVPGLATPLMYAGPFILLIKVVLLLFIFVWLRSTLPRIRYDRLMAFGWKITFPLALLSVLITAAALVLVG